MNNGIHVSLPIWVSSGYMPRSGIAGSYAGFILQYKILQYCCLENTMKHMNRQNDKILKEELHRSLSVQYATGDQWRNNSKKNEGMEPTKTIPSCGCDW